MARFATISVLAAALAASAGGTARAASPPFRFAWTAPSGCPDKAGVLARVGELVGPAARAEDDLWFEADVTPLESGRWRAVLKSGWSGASTERRFESASCANIASATAFIIAMSLDPAGVAERATREPSPARVPDAVEPGPEKAAPVVSPREESSFHLALGPRTTGDVGSLPKASLGAGGGLALWRGPWLVSASGQAWLPRQTAGNVYGAGGEIGLVTGELRGCASIARTSTRIDLCAGAEGGTSEGVGTGVSQPLKARGLWLAALAGIALRPSASGPFGAWVGFDVGVPLTIPTYVIDGIGEVHRPSPVFARASMGVEFRAF
jgi:hypothetical protein